MKKRQKNKKNRFFNIVLFIILITLIIIIITMGIFSNKNKAKVIETKTFSEIPGFSFEYPVFEGWEANKIEKINNDEYYIHFSIPAGIELFMAPQVNIKKEKIGLTSQGIGNPQNIPYYIKDSILTFYDNEKSIKISLVAGGREKEGFSQKILFDKIIETFKFTPTPESEGYILLTNLSAFPKKYQNGTLAVIERLKQDKENPEDYYVRIKEAEEFNTNTIIISLIHKDTFNQENNVIKMGNPSGKDREIYYNLDLKKFVKELFYQ